MRPTHCFRFDFRCIHLAQPPLDEIEIDQIEKIVSIYAHNDADTMETTTSDGSVEVKVYTLNDAIESAAEAEANQSQTASIWREAPGKLVELLQS